MEGLDEVVAADGFAGVVRVRRGGSVEVELAVGAADRRWSIPNTTSTRFAVASGSKTFTAVVVLRLVEEGLLALDQPARSLLGDDLPLIAGDVTVEHLLSHRSGIGDYIDEDEVEDTVEHVLPGSMHTYDSTAAFLPALDGHPTAFPAGERFAYNNGGFAVLAVLAERAAGTSYIELVQRHVLGPAAMDRSGFFRSDELPPHTAVGYLGPPGGEHGDRTNVFHLPVVPTGDGGAYTTLDDVERFWSSFLDGRLVSPASVVEATRPRSEGYGLGLWLRPERGVLQLEGADAGAAFRSLRRPDDDLTVTIISNHTDGAWAVSRFLEEQLGLR